MQKPWPKVMTQADIAPAVAPGAARVIETTGAADSPFSESPLGGVQQVMDWIEKIQPMAKDFFDRVEKFGDTINGLRAYESGQEGDGGFDDGEVFYANSLGEPPSQNRSATSPPVPMPPAGESDSSGDGMARNIAQTLEPQKVYAFMLGRLAELATEYPDMTMKEALELARVNKMMVVAAIAQELPKLLGDE